ncbi:MAG: UDP-N-acetylmuramoyl-tripeptide--D-alanyl-D-alanine ligase, partial [Phycisphaerae bacterium]|nr:UDP-N-acetylmuramoyl-tripeptide--D-alanyl-D-alanine ligase [Phycisphaerae bacterium]
TLVAPTAVEPLARFRACPGGKPYGLADPVQLSISRFFAGEVRFLAAGAADDFVILEMGTNAPGEIAYLASVGRPDIGVVTLVAEAHLAGLGDLDAIAAEKSALVESLPADGLAVLNADDERVMGLAGQSSARVVTFGVEAEADYRAEGVELTPDGLSFRAGGCRVRMPVLAGYYAGLAMATMAVAEAMGVPPEDVTQDLAEYKPPPMRLERKVFGDVIVISDAYNANWRSWLAALEVLKLWPRRNKVVFAGDMLEMGAESGRLHRALGEEIAKSGVSRLVTVGAESAETRRGAIAAGLAEDRALHVADSATAADEAGSVVNRGEVVLVKGSRRMVMERVVEALSAKFAGGG